MEFNEFFEREIETELRGDVARWGDLTPAQQQSVDGADTTDHFLVAPDGSVMPVMRLWEQAERAVEMGHMASQVLKVLNGTGLVEIEARPGTLKVSTE